MLLLISLRLLLATESSEKHAETKREQNDNIDGQTSHEHDYNVVHVVGLSERGKSEMFSSRKADRRHLTNCSVLALILASTPTA